MSPRPNPVNVNPASPASGPRRRRGCLGCLAQLLWQAAIALALGVVLILAITAIFAPWSFYLGGQFHIIPYWQGWGKMHAKSGDYVVFVEFGPTSRGSHVIAHSNLKGIGYLCTPRGEELRMSLGGSMRPYLPVSTDGEPIDLYMNYWPALYGQFITDRRPGIELRGHWKNPNLVMDDTGSIFRAFLPDGSVYRGHDTNHPYNGEVVPVTLAKGSYSEFKAACADVKK